MTSYSCDLDPVAIVKSWQPKLPAVTPPLWNARKVQRQPCCEILPPHMKEKLNKFKREQEKVVEEVEEYCEELRHHRQMHTKVAYDTPYAPMAIRRADVKVESLIAIYNAKHGTELPGDIARTDEIQYDADADADVNRAWDIIKTALTFYKVVLKRNSVDGEGGRVKGIVHYGKKYQNALWDGRFMICGDGDGKYVRDFTRIDIIGHELGHGIVQHEAALEYHDEPGAENEFFADMYGKCLRDFSQNVTVDKSDFKIGDQVIYDQYGRHAALRNMKDPGTAYGPNHPIFGDDLQPKHMAHFVHTKDDNGGVHYNSGILNWIFTNYALNIGGFSYEKPLQIWHHALCQQEDQSVQLMPTSKFVDLAKATIASSGVLFGRESREQKELRVKWFEGGVLR